MAHRGVAPEDVGDVRGAEPLTDADDARQDLARQHDRRGGGLELVEAVVARAAILFRVAIAEILRQVAMTKWLGGYLFLVLGLLSLWQFAYLTVAIRRFYLATGRWGSRLLSMAVAMLLYVLNAAFMTGVQVAGAAIALAMS